MPGTFRISGGDLTIPSGIIVDADIASNASIGIDKMKHAYKMATNFALAIGATPVAREEIIFVADAACTLRGFHALLNDTGTTSDVDFDLKINGVSALTGVVNITNANSDRQIVDGVLSTTVLAADDVVSISLAVTTSTGAQGPFAWVSLEENAAPN
jgi:hypothetical protein